MGWGGVCVFFDVTAVFVLKRLDNLSMYIYQIWCSDAFGAFAVMENGYFDKNIL